MKIDILDPKTHAMKELRIHRERSGMQQSDVAERLDCGQSRVSWLERQEATILRLQHLRKYVEAVGGTIKVTVEFPDMGEQAVS